MRVLVLHRPAGMLGGDTGAAQCYAAGLRANGVEAVARPANDLANIVDYDIAHIFAAVSPDWGLPAAQAVKAAGKPLFITPIWWTRRPRLDYYGMGDDVYPGYTGHVAQVMRLADVLAVYTMSEALQVWQLLPRHRVHVMGCGHDGVEVEDSGKVMDYVLTIGRIEKHKNQHSVAMACRELLVPYVCVGPVADGPYAAKVQALGGKLTGERSHAVTMSLLAQARVYALASFSENVSVATCEANALGVPAVIGNIGCEPEFFGTGPVYCNPADWRDIAGAISEARERERGQWASVPTWATVAAGMVEEYGKWL